MKMNHIANWFIEMFDRGIQSESQIALLRAFERGSRIVSAGFPPGAGTGIIALRLAAPIEINMMRNSVQSRGKARSAFEAWQSVP
jgi:hypothetical protein